MPGKFPCAFQICFIRIIRGWAFLRNRFRFSDFLFRTRVTSKSGNDEPKIDNSGKTQTARPRQSCSVCRAAHAFGYEVRFFDDTDPLG